MGIKITDFERALVILNRKLNRPDEPYKNGEPQPGNFHLSQQNGGVCIAEMSKDGGARTPILSYHATKRETYQTLIAFMDGIDAAREQDK